MMIVVRTSIRFDEFDRFDPLLHVARNDLTLSHFECGGAIKITPRAFRRGLLGLYKPTQEAAHSLQCSGCGESAGPFDSLVLSRTLAQFLTGPDWQTAPAQHLTDTVIFVPPDWPPRRRHQQDRRQGDTRYTVDRSMEGSRRRDRDRRQDPTAVDGP